ncbi:MAG: hypothetical protein SNJ59_11635 [Aggregatilineales bacterium]
MKLVLNSALKPFAANAIGLRMPCFGFAVVDVPNRPIPLLLMLLQRAAVFCATICQHRQQRYFPSLKEQQYAIIERACRHQRVLAVVKLGEHNSAVGVDEEGLLVDTLALAIICCTPSEDVKQLVLILHKPLAVVSV